MAKRAAEESKKEKTPSKKTSFKKTKESPEVTKKKKTRDNISDAGIRKIFIQSTHDIKIKPSKSGKGNKGNIRVSNGSISLARTSVNGFLRELARESERRLKMAEKKTLTDQIIRDIVTGNNGMTKLARFGITVEHLHPESKGAADVSLPLSLSGTVRTFKKNFKELNISGDAKKAVLGSAIAYLSQLGHSSACISASSGRITIGSRDVETALTILYRC